MIEGKHTMTYTQNNLQPITSWAEDERPREKLVNLGPRNLSNSELLAILLGSGNRDENAVQLARRILAGANNNLRMLGKMTIENLQEYKGIGLAKAITITAAIELGRRRQFAEAEERLTIVTSRDVYEYASRFMRDLPYEEFWVIILNRANKIIGKKRISQGGVSGTVVDARIIFREAIQKLASSIILLHNHPSGQLRASQQDIKVTKKIHTAGKSLDIVVVDHIIFTDDGYYSFKDEGLL